MVNSILKYFNGRYIRAWLVLVCDILMSLAASAIVVLGVGYLLKLIHISHCLLLVYLAISFVVSVLAFVITRTYRIIIRHFTIKDILPFFASVLLKGLVLMSVMSFVGAKFKWTVIIVLCDILLTAALLIGVRLVMILVYNTMIHLQQKTFNKQRILLFGTSDKSVAAIKRLENSPHYMLSLLPVFGFTNDHQLTKIINKERVDAILFTRSIDAQDEESGLISWCSQHGIKTLISPSVDEVTEGQTLFRPREVSVEDLLGREEIIISMDKIKEYFAGKVVMVTGAAGSIGSELVRQLATFGVKQIVLYDNAETPMHNIRLELEDNFKDLDFVPVIGSVRHPERLDYAFRKWRPQVVFHAAAYKHVPLMEENPCEAVLANVYGSRNVADKCLEYDVERMVMISTDKAVNPTNIMGCTKRLAEIYVQSLGMAVQEGRVKGKTRFVTTRFGNVLGSNGSVIPRFRQQIEQGGPVTVTHPDINRFFMTIPEACRLVMEAATMSTGNNIFVFDMGKPVKIDQLARRMITLAGLTPDKDIKIEYTGLRPGEKLYEEVLSNEENTLPSFHERIRVAKVREYDYSDALQNAMEFQVCRSGQRS